MNGIFSAPSAPQVATSPTIFAGKVVSALTDTASPTVVQHVIEMQLSLKKDQFCNVRMKKVLQID